MITKPTVLILGAGASKPYGFPTAALGGDPGLFDRLRLDKSFLNEFGKDLQKK